MDTVLHATDTSDEDNDECIQLQEDEEENEDEEEDEKIGGLMLYDEAGDDEED